MAPRDEAFQDLLRQLKTVDDELKEELIKELISSTHTGDVEIPKDSNIRNEEHKKIETPKPKD